MRYGEQGVPVGPRILGSSGTPQSHTGDTNESVLATITVPANLLGTNGTIRGRAYFTFTNNGNNKILRARFGGIGGTAYFQNTFTVNGFAEIAFAFANNNATNSQKGILSGGNIYNSVAGATSAIDTTAATTIVLTVALANGTDTGQLEGYTIEYLPAV
jgi:hypothetical protein